MPRILQKPFIHNGQKGSITVMIALLLPVLFLMMAMIVNVSQLVYTKIRLQTTVDACALSAAAVQAAGLNEIADLNWEMENEFKKIKNFLSPKSGTWYSYGEALQAKNFFYNGSNGVIDHIKKYQLRSNQIFADDAEKTAQHVKKKNFPQSILRPSHPSHDTKKLTVLIEPPRARVSFKYFRRSFSKGSPVRTIKWSDPPPPDSPKHSGSHDGRYASYSKRTSRTTGKFSILKKIRKTTPTFVNYELFLRPQPFWVADTIFGQTPPLIAKAAARPAGGDVYRQQPFYRAVLAR